MLNIKLRELRKEKRLTMKELGKILSLAEPTISGYENGTRSPDYETLNKIADVFNVSTDYLLGRTDKRQPATTVNKEGTEEQNSTVLCPIFKSFYDLQKFWIIWGSVKNEEWQRLRWKANEYFEKLSFVHMDKLYAKGNPSFVVFEMNDNSYSPFFHEDDHILIVDAGLEEKSLLNGDIILSSWKEEGEEKSGFVRVFIERNVFIFQDLNTHKPIIVKGKHRIYGKVIQIFRNSLL